MLGRDGRDWAKGEMETSTEAKAGLGLGRRQKSRRVRSVQAEPEEGVHSQPCSPSPRQPLLTAGGMSLHLGRGAQGQQCRRDTHLLGLGRGTGDLVRNWTWDSGVRSRGLSSLKAGHWHCSRCLCWAPGMCGAKTGAWLGPYSGLSASCQEGTLDRLMPSSAPRLALKPSESSEAVVTKGPQPAMLSACPET